MSVSLIILSIIILMIMFGVGQRILDSLRLNDIQALVILILICIGIVIPPIWIGQYFCFSIGGFLIPFALAIYMLISCGWSRDLLRAFIGTIFVAGIIYGLEWLLPSSPEGMIIDNTYIYGVVAGVVAYALGRSRRNAFVSAIFGLSLAQLVQWLVNLGMHTKTILGLGVGGAFGTYIVAIIISVAVSEFLGRCFETSALKKEKKVFNYETHTYDSEKNGKLENAKVNKQNRDRDLRSTVKDLTDKEKLKTAKNSKNKSKNASKSSFVANYEEEKKNEK